MRIQIYGNSKSISNAEIRFATRFFTKTLFKETPEILKELDYVIDIRSMRDKGGCSIDEDDQFKKDPRSFVIDVHNRLSRRTTLKTLAHECVHAWQFATNKLRNGKGDIMIWNRRSFNIEEIEYWDLPSEIDAFGREEGLYYRYLDHCKEKNVKFLKSNNKKALYPG